MILLWYTQPGSVLQLQALQQRSESSINFQFTTTFVKKYTILHERVYQLRYCVTKMSKIKWDFSRLKKKKKKKIVQLYYTTRIESVL